MFQATDLLFFIPLVLCLPPQEDHHVPSNRSSLLYPTRTLFTTSRGSSCSKQPIFSSLSHSYSVYHLKSIIMFQATDLLFFIPLVLCLPPQEYHHVPSNRS